MNISSTPFIRNDYWPDYNDIDILNKRIDEAENETSLVNSRLTNDIENVSNNLNSYKNEMADAVITNNIIVNNLNANYAIGKYANFINTNTDNAYIENLTVNKPVFDLTLNTPHVENITSIGGNFYDANLFNVAVENITGSINDSTITNSTLVNATVDNLSGTIVNSTITDSTLVNAILDGNGVLGNVEINNTVINTANVAELFVNTQPEPVTSSAVLGYDSEGRVIPIKAAFEVGFPENANYLFTDQYGTAFPGTAETEVNASNNLITSNAVYNALANVNNGFNNVNNFVNNGFNAVANNFNAVANNFNDVANNFNNVANNFNNVNNTANNLLDNVDYLKTALAPLLSLPVANVSGWVNSTTPVNIQGITSFVVAPFAAPTMLSSADVGDGAKLDVTGTTARLGLPGFQWTMESMNNTFLGCTSLNQNILIPNSVTELDNTFNGCTSLNQNILIPNSVISLSQTFNGCTSLNQNILIPNSVTNLGFTFNNCTSLNQNILIPNSVTEPDSTFFYCTSLNQNILIPNSVTDLNCTFFGCTSLNQNILIPNSVTDLGKTFWQCTNLNQNILIPNSVTSLAFTFNGCTSLNQPDIYIYSQNVFLLHAFYQCHINNVHIPTSVPKDTSNNMYNCFVNGWTGITFPEANIFNDLPVDVEQWPPV